MRLLFLLSAFALLPVLARGEERFPPPEFGPEYRMPELAQPPPESPVGEYASVVVLVLALGLASWLAVKRRSRRGLFVLMCFSLLWLGFFKEGCVCAVGAIQNVALAFSDGGYAIPFSVLAFFFLPLLFTLIFGRTFCAAVCPFGALQDLCLLRPVRVPEWLEHALGLLPFVYLAAAVLFAATGSAFLICQYDPFVAFFRREGSFSMLVLGASVLVISVFVGRAYCRWVCPYGALLGLLTRLARWHVAITPNNCVDCSLCNDACPFGAIQPPTPKRAPLSRTQGKRRLAALLLLTPVLVAVGALIGNALNVPLSRMHATVRLAERVQLEESGAVQGLTDASEAFRKTGQPVKDLYAEALAIRGRYATGAAWLGGALGLMLGVKLIVLTLRRRRTDFEVIRENCVACGRCFEFCPKERAKWTTPQVAVGAEQQ